MKKNKVGNKAINLKKLEELGFNVPNFVVISESSLKHFKSDKHIYESVKQYFFSKYGGNTPKLVSVRSSGSVSTPGRMKTILNVSLESEEAFIKAFNEVKKSTTSQKLKKYLKVKGVEDFTYSIVIQEMVFGNLTTSSCSGVLITTNPYDKSTSEYYLEAVLNNTGDALMSGETTPIHLEELSLVNPIAKEKLDSVVSEIKKQFETNQEVEFVIQGMQIFILQTRDYKLSTTVLKNEETNLTFIGQGKAVNKITAQGTLTYLKENANSDYIWLTESTEFEDTEAILNFAGLITKKGGRLSHASIIANEFNLPCVVGSQFEKEPKEGDRVLIDENGTIFLIN